MLVSHRKKFIYTKTFKAASTSVEVYFEPYCMPEGNWKPSEIREPYESKTGIIGYRGINSEGKKWFNHMPAALIKERLGEKVWNDYFKFCVIRNPFDKMVSAFYFFFNLRNHRDFEKSHPILKQQVMKIHDLPGKNMIEKFRAFVANREIYIDRENYMIDEDYCMDYFIRFEDLPSGVEHVCKTLDIPFKADIPRLKTQNRPKEIPLEDYYDEPTEKNVSELFAPEIEKFGYSLHSTERPSS